MLLTLENLGIAAGCGTVVFLLFSVFGLVFSPLSQVPGPFWARLTNWWYFQRVAKGHFEHDNLNLHRKYGRIVRYGPNRYSFDDAEAAKSIYGLGSHFPKSSWYMAWSNPGQWSIFADQNIARHNNTRRLMQNAYSMSSLVTYEPFVDECANIFSTRMDEVANTDLAVDMGHWLQCYAFDVIGYMTFSKRLGFLDHGEDVENVIAALEDHLVYATLTGIFPKIHRLLFHLRNSLSGGGAKGRAYVIKFTKERIAEHEKRVESLKVSTNENTELLDFLSKFYYKHAADPNVFTNFHLLTGCATNMVAGSDTTAVSLSAILYYLLKFPESLQRLREEVSNVRALSGNRKISFQESLEMPYLQAVIKEGLRMHPATGLPLERVVPDGGATICDQYFPAGTVVGVNSWVMHRNTDIFGKDAEIFRPERWLTADAAKLSVMNRNWMPFGLGSRSCLGRHVSILEISKLIPRFVTDFEFELCEPPLSHWTTTNFWFVKPRNFNVKIRTRNRKSKACDLHIPGQGQSSCVV